MGRALKKDALVTPPPVQHQPRPSGPPGQRSVSRAHQGDALGQRDATIAAAVLTVLAHLVVFTLLPRELAPLPQRETRRPPRTYELQLEPSPAPEDRVAEPEKQPLERVEEPEKRFVMAPSGIPDQVPADDRNFSDRNQIAANPEKPETLSDDQSPMVKGDMEESNRLVQGNPEKAPPVPPEAGTPEAIAAYMQKLAAPKPVPAQTPSPQERPVEEAKDAQQTADLLEKPKKDDGILARQNSEVGTAEEAPKKSPGPEPQRPRSEPPPEATSPTDGQGKDATTEVAQMAAQAAGPRPRPRIRLESESSYGPIKQSRGGVLRIGNLAFNSRYSEFGDYWRRCGEMIENRWRSLVYGSRAILPNGHIVTVEFTIHRDGQVSDIRIKESTAVGPLAETISTDAIASVAPFREWTPEMIATMDEKTVCTVSCIY